jgi:hypothetical protein
MSVMRHASAASTQDPKLALNRCPSHLPAAATAMSSDAPSLAPNDVLSDAVPLAWLESPPPVDGAARNEDAGHARAPAAGAAAAHAPLLHGHTSAAAEHAALLALAAPLALHTPAAQHAPPAGATAAATPPTLINCDALLSFPPFFVRAPPPFVAASASPPPPRAARSWAAAVEHAQLLTAHPCWGAAAATATATSHEDEDDEEEEEEEEEEDLFGRRLRMFWPGQGGWYDAVVTAYDPTRRDAPHRITYALGSEDESFEWVDLHALDASQVRWLHAPRSKAAALRAKREPPPAAPPDVPRKRRSSATMMTTRYGGGARAGEGGSASGSAIAAGVSDGGASGGMAREKRPRSDDDEEDGNSDADRADGGIVATATAPPPNPPAAPPRVTNFALVPQPPYPQPLPPKKRARHTFARSAISSAAPPRAPVSAAAAAALVASEPAPQVSAKARAVAEAHAGARCMPSTRACDIVAAALAAAAAAPATADVAHIGTLINPATGRIMPPVPGVVRATATARPGGTGGKFSARVTRLLAEAYALAPYPTRVTRVALAAQTGLTPEQTRVWFMNARKRGVRLAPHASWAAEPPTTTAVVPAAAPAAAGGGAAAAAAAPDGGNAVRAAGADAAAPAAAVNSAAARDDAVSAGEQQ